MKRLILVAVTSMISVLTVMPANALCLDTANPNTSLAGTWAFKTEGVSYYGAAIAGTFVASSTGTGRFSPTQGMLDILASSNLSGLRGTVYGASVYIGTFQIDTLCNHGTLNIATSRPNLGSVYDFYFTNPAKTEMFLVGMQSDYVFTGIARKIHDGPVF